MTIMTRATEIKTALEGARVRTFTDPRKVTVPCALIGPSQAEFDDNCIGSADTTWTVHLLSAPPGNSDAMKDLADMAAKALTVLPVQAMTAGSYAVDEGTEYPSYTLIWEETAQWT